MPEFVERQNFIFSPFSAKHYLQDSPPGCIIQYIVVASQTGRFAGAEEPPLRAALGRPPSADSRRPAGASRGAPCSFYEAGGPGDGTEEGREGPGRTGLGGAAELRAHRPDRLGGGEHVFQCVPLQHHYRGHGHDRRHGGGQRRGGGGDHPDGGRAVGQAGGAQAHHRHGLSAVGPERHGLRPGAGEWAGAPAGSGKGRPDCGGAGDRSGLRDDLLWQQRQRRGFQRLGHRRHRRREPGPGGGGAGRHAAGGHAGGLRCPGRPDHPGEVGDLLPCGGRTDPAGRRLGPFAHSGAGEPPPGRGQLRGEHPLRPAPGGRLGQSLPVSGPAGPGGVRRQPAGVYALPHHLYPALPWGGQLRRDSGRGAYRRQRGQRGFWAGNRPARKAPCGGPRRRYGLRRAHRHVLRPGYGPCYSGGHGDAGSQHGPLRLPAGTHPGPHPRP